MTECRDCGVEEGHLHTFTCDQELCPFCGGQLISCDCAEKHFYPDGVPESVFNNGLSHSQMEEWEKTLRAKGLVPWISFPWVCARCGGLRPDLFMVPDKEWERIVPIRQRNKILCRVCFDRIKELVDQAARTARS